MSTFVCRCGMTISRETLDLINHVASAEHDERMQTLGLRTEPDPNRCTSMGGLKDRCVLWRDHIGAHQFTGTRHD